MKSASDLKVLLNGNLIEKKEAVVNLDTVAFKYGTMVFEGLRGYWNEQQQQLYIFRLDDHSKRLEQSVRLMRMKTRHTQAPWTVSSRTRNPTSL